MHPIPDSPLQVTLAHAVKDFTDQGRRYLAGELYPVDGKEPEKVRRLVASRFVAYGAAPPRKAEVAAKRRAELQDAELEAATAPSSEPAASASSDASAPAADAATSRRARSRS